MSKFELGQEAFIIQPTFSYSGDCTYRIRKVYCVAFQMRNDNTFLPDEEWVQKENWVKVAFAKTAHATESWYGESQVYFTEEEARLVLTLRGQVDE